MTVSSWLNFGRPMPPGRDLWRAKILGSALLQPARSVCISLSAFSFIVEILDTDWSTSPCCHRFAVYWVPFQLPTFLLLWFFIVCSVNVINIRRHDYDCLCRLSWVASQTRRTSSGLVKEFWRSAPVKNISGEAVTFARRRYSCNFSSQFTHCSSRSCVARWPSG